MSSSRRIPDSTADVVAALIDAVEVIAGHRKQTKFANERDAQYIVEGAPFVAQNGEPADPALPSIRSLMTEKRWAKRLLKALIRPPHRVAVRPLVSTQEVEADTRSYLNHLEALYELDQIHRTNEDRQNDDASWLKNLLLTLRKLHSALVHKAPSITPPDLAACARERANESPANLAGAGDLASQPTVGELAGEAGISNDTFGRIRTAAGIRPKLKGAPASYRRYTQKEVDKLIAAALAGNFRERTAMAKKWARWGTEKHGTPHQVRS